MIITKTNKECKILKEIKKGGMRKIIYVLIRRCLMKFNYWRTHIGRENGEDQSTQKKREKRGETEHIRYGVGFGFLIFHISNIYRH